MTILWDTKDSSRKTTTSDPRFPVNRTSRRVPGKEEGRAKVMTVIKGRRQLVRRC